MNSNKLTARLVGPLFWISNITFIAGVLMIEQAISAPDYLSLISENRAQVVLGVLLEIINAIAYLGIAMLMYPLFRKRFESMALGYVSFRVLEFVMQALAGLGVLALLSLGEGSLAAGASEVFSFQVAGAALLAQRAWAFQMVSITFGLGAVLFYLMLFKSNLVPKFISVWGLLGAAIVLMNTGLDMFGITPGNLGFLMLLNELFLGIWLIVKGFNKPPAVSEPANN